MSEIPEPVYFDIDIESEPPRRYTYSKGESSAPRFSAATFTPAMTDSPLADRLVKRVRMSRSNNKRLIKCTD